MSKYLKTLISTFLICIFLFSIFVSVVPITTKAQPWNAFFVVDINWLDEEILKPIVPRDEVKEIKLNVTLQIKTGDTVGRGIYDIYESEKKYYGVVLLDIIDSSPWCSVVLNHSKVVVPWSRIGHVETAVFINIEEDAPAYGAGFITIQAEVKDAGLVQGMKNEYSLEFLPSFNPILKLNLPESNVKRIDPTLNAVFPIEVENIGNARTKIFFEVEDVPKDWKATVTDVIILDEQKGSSGTAYLTVIPPKEAGYHYEEVNIRVKMTPARAEDTEDKGNAMYASFTVQNRGLSTFGSEALIFYGIIAFIIIILVVFIFRYITNRRKKTTQ
ncbi:hypothetical protein AYK24_07885 [Thermoplasmatales archaeon SG8-52-4]|nr:MAG: hypothetical protein AYK24_07885 [Thermoplasmatales archaeon SG8-52-4]